MREGNVFKWLLEVEVPECWVKDGFDFHEDRCRDVAESIVRFTYLDKVKVRVVQAPDPRDLRRAQGHEELPGMKVTSDAAASPGISSAMAPVGERPAKP